MKTPWDAGLDSKGVTVSPYTADSQREVTVRNIFRVIGEGPPRKDFETKRLMKTGGLVDVSISASRFSEHDGKPTGMLVILRDISVHKRASKDSLILPTDVDEPRGRPVPEGSHNRLIERVAPAMKELRRMLEAFDPKAIDSFHVMKPQVDVAGIELHVAELARLLWMYDFTECSDRITVSIGAGRTVPTSDASPFVLLEIADRMLCEAKRNGRNRMISGEV